MFWQTGQYSGRPNLGATPHQFQLSWESSPAQVSFWHTLSLRVFNNRTDRSIHQRPCYYSPFSLISFWTIVFHNFTYFITILSHNLWFSYFSPFCYVAVLELQNCVTIYFETMMSGQGDFKFNTQHGHFLNHSPFNIYSSLYFGKASNSSATTCLEKSRSHELCRHTWTKIPFAWWFCTRQIGFLWHLWVNISFH